MAVHQMEFVLMQAIIIFCTLPELTDANCVEKLEAAAAIGDTVQFHICDYNEWFMYMDIIDVVTDEDGFHVEKDRWTNGWFWDVDEHFDLDIHVNITSEENFGTARVYLFFPFYERYYVTVFTTGHPELCNKTIVQTQTLAANFGDSVNSTLCILNLDDTLRAELKVEQQSSIVPPERSLFNSFNVRVQSGTGRYHEQELVFEVTDMSEADVGNWTVRVNNTYGALTIDVVIEAIAPPSMCDNEHQNLTMSAHSGEILQFSICFLCRDGKQPYIQNISKFSERTQQYEASDSSLTVSISTRGDDLIEHEIGVSIDSMSEEDAGLWVITVATQSEWLDVYFTLEMLVPPTMCEGESQNRTISSHIGEPLYFTFCIQCIDGKEPYIQTISKFSERAQQNAAPESSLTVSISERGDDLIKHEIGVSVDSMSEEDAGLWVITVATQSGWVDVYFTLEMLEQRPSPSASNDALAIGLGLTSVVIVIVIAVGVVWAIRRFRGKDKTKTALSNSGDTTENPETTHTKHINLAFSSETETDPPGTREPSSVEAAETSRMSKEKTIGRLDHVSGPMVQQESGDIDGLKDGAPHTRRSSQSSLSDLESEDDIDQSFYDIGPDGGIQILKSNPETSSSLYDIPPERKRSEKTFNPYELPKATAILWRSSNCPKNTKTVISSHKMATDALHLTNTNHKHTDSQKCFKPGPKNRSQSYENVPNELIKSNVRRNADRQNYINVVEPPNTSSKSKSNESPAVDTATPDKDSKVALKPHKLQPKRKTSCAHPSAKQAEAEKASIPASNRPESYENISDEQINAKSSHASANIQNRTSAGDTTDSSTTSRNIFADAAKHAQNLPAKPQNFQKSSKPGPYRPQAYENVSDGQMNTKFGSAVDTEYSNSLLNINKSPSKTINCSATNSEFLPCGTKRPKIPPKKHLQPNPQITVLYPNAKRTHAQTSTTPGPLHPESYENILLISVGADKQNLKRNPEFLKTSSGDKVSATTADPETYENVLVQKYGTVIIPQQ